MKCTTSRDKKSRAGRWRQVHRYPVSAHTRQDTNGLELTAPPSPLDTHRDSVRMEFWHNNAESGI